MFSKLDIPLRGPSVNIVKRCGPAVADVLQSKFGCVASIHGVDFEGDRNVTQQTGTKVVPEKRFTGMLPSGVQVSVWKADLTIFPADAVVNAANEHLQHYGGLALALSIAGGPEIQKQSDAYIDRHGPLKTGNALIMTAGSLPCNSIIHAVGPQLPKYPPLPDLARAESQLKMAITSILDIVRKCNKTSVAIPAISSGIFNYPLQECADTIVTTVKDYYKKSSGHLPKEIMFVNNDEPTVKAMERACHQILSQQQPKKSSQAAASKKRDGAKTPVPPVQIGNVLLTLKKGKIEEQQTDVIVNTTYNRNLSNGQISNAILQKAGQGMQAEMYNAPLYGHLFITKSHKLQCKEVYHTCISVKGKETGQLLYISVSECLSLASKKLHKSIAFPAIGTGGLEVDKKEAARIMSQAVAIFAQTCPEKMDVYFVIFPADDATFQAFEEQIRYVRENASDPSLRHDHEHRDDRGSRAPSPQISLSGPSEEATREAERWLQGLFFESLGSVIINNNFILHFGEQEHLKLSRLMKKGVSIAEMFERSRASIVVQGDSKEDVVVAALRVEAMLCEIQREFVREEESALSLMSTMDVSFKQSVVEHNAPEFLDRMSAFKQPWLRVVKVLRVENAALRTLFNLKKKQLSCTSSQKMFQCIPAQFCEMVSRIGFHAEFAPPDDPAYGEGIYFASTVNKALQLWKEPNNEYLHFVEAEVLTGNSTHGKPGLILPPAVGIDPQTRYDSVSGGSEVSVIFSGYQALPRYIITCKICNV